MGGREDRTDLPMVPTAPHVDAKPLRDPCVLTIFSLMVRNMINSGIEMSIALLGKTVKVGDMKKARWILRLRTNESH